MPDWGSAGDAGSPRSMAGSYSRASRSHAGSFRAAAPSAKIRARLVDALPDDLRVYYLGSE